MTARRLPPAVCVALLLALLVNASIFWISHQPSPRPLFGDETMYEMVGRKLAQGQRWWPNPIWPPLLFTFFAGVFEAGGGRMAIQGIQLSLLFGAALILADLTRHLTGSRFAGSVAGYLMVSYPPLVAFAGFLWPEILHLFFLIASWWLLVRRRHPVARAFAGVLLGLTILSRYLLWPFLPGLLLPLFSEGTWRRRLVSIGSVALGFSLVVGAFIYRGRPNPLRPWITSSPIFNMWVGLNERSRRNFVDPVVGEAYKSYRASSRSIADRDLILLTKILDKVRDEGVPALLARQLGRQYFRLFDKDSFFTDMLPGGEIAALGGGYVRPPPALATGLRWTSYVSYSLILLGAVVGLTVCPHAGRRWLQTLVLFLLYNLGIFLIVHVKTRYRVPMLPVLFLYTGCACAWGAAKLGWTAEAQPFRDRVGTWSWAVCAVAAATLLFFAWGGPWLP